MQDRLREDISQCPNPTYDDLMGGKMEYLDAVCREAYVRSAAAHGSSADTYTSLRLYPPVPYVERVAGEDDVLPLRHPVVAPSGEPLYDLPIRKGQVSSFPRTRRYVTPALT